MSFETLPNEVFLHYIFPLFSLEELYKTFVGLNRRFDNLLQGVNHLKFTVNAENEHHPALKIFAQGIASLTVCLGRFHLRPFSNLRSLILQYPSLQQRNAIRPESFLHLEYLKLAYPLEDPVLLTLIFSNGFEHLKSCHFDRVFVDHSWTGSPKLRSLSASVHASYGIMCILHACPNIVQLNLIVYSTPQKNLSLPRQSISCMNGSLRYIFLRAEFRILMGVLQCSPNLISLTFEDITIHYAGDSSDFDLTRLAGALRTLHQLTSLRCTIDRFAWKCNVPWQSLHPLFRSISNDRSGVIISSSVIENS